MGMLVPEQYGGAGLTYYEYKMAIEELAKVCGSIGLSMAAHNSLCTGHILQFGNEEQKQTWLPKLASGQWIGAWGLTEANTGSDAMRMRCVAEKDGDEWVLNGTKNWITHGITGDVAVVLARTGELLDSRGITAFVVERGTPGFSGGKKENKLGMRSSETAEMIFDQCRIPESNVLGEVGEGLHPSDEDFGRRTHQHCLVGAGHGQRSVEHSHAVRQGTRAIWSAHCPVPSHRLQARRHGHVDRGGRLVDLASLRVERRKANQ